MLRYAMLRSLALVTLLYAKLTAKLNQVGNSSWCLGLPSSLVLWNLNLQNIVKLISTLNPWYPCLSEAGYRLLRSN